MNRYVIMVDAGYLLHQSVAILSGKATTRRDELDVHDPAGLIALLIQKANASLALGNKELLRVYWYDGVGTGLTQQQRALVGIDDVQLRAGTINGSGQQKGVDSLIVTDLIELTSHHAICDAVVVTGDSDLAIGIELAQRRGVRIAAIGIEDLAAGVSHKQSFEITSRADRVGYIGGSDLAPLMRHVPKTASAVASRKTAAPTPVPPPAPATAVGAALTAAGVVVSPSSAPVSAHASSAAVVQPAGAQATPSKPPRVSVPLTAVEQSDIEAAVRTFISQQAQPLTTAVDPVTKRIDGGVDRALLHHVYTTLHVGALTNHEKIFARDVLRREV